MTGYSVEVLADSVSPDGVRLVSLLTTYPRFIHAEMLRHRVFSHSVASSRAIPPERLIEQVERYPFVPEFARRVLGMGVGEPLRGHELKSARDAWARALNSSLESARRMVELNVDKSRVNRLLEPYLYVTDIITGTEWSNFLALRDHPDAQPEFRIIARMMREAMDVSEPETLDYGEWHLPLVLDEEIASMLVKDDREWDELKRISAGRVARVSFDRHGDVEDHVSSINRARRLIESGHLSPFEHVARPINPSTSHVDSKWILHGFNPDGVLDDEIEVVDGVNRLSANTFVNNFRGWIQMRAEIPNQHDFSRIVAERTVGPS